MSRQSQAFAQGIAKFSWKVSKGVDDAGADLYTVTCRNQPSISATGSTEQRAIQAAQRAIETAVETCATDMRGPGQI